MSQIQVNKSTVKKINLTDRVSNKTICTLRFARDENGLSVYCKSPIFETFFKRISEGMEDDWDGLKGYYVSRVNARNVDSSIGLWGANRLFTDRNIPQISWIRSVGIRTGITFHFNTLPVHLDDYKKYIEGVIKSIEHMYNEYLRPKNTTGKITSKLSGDI